MAGSKKELIRETAINVFAELGFYQTTTDKISQEAGISVGTIYNYYRNKEAILEYIFEVELENRKKFLQNLKQTEIPFTEMIEQLLTRHFQEIKKNPDVAHILIRERNFPQIKELKFVYQFIQGVPREIASLLDKAISAGELPQFGNGTDVILVGAALFGAVEGIAREAMFQDNPDERDLILDRAPKVLTELFFKGLASD